MIRLNLDCKEILARLEYITNVVIESEDESLKNIIFYVGGEDKNEIYLLGENRQIVCKSLLEESTVLEKPEEDEYYLSLNAKEFTSLLKTLNSMKKTKIQELILEDKSPQTKSVRLVISEEAVSEDVDFADYLNRKSYFMFDKRKVNLSDKEKLKINRDDYEFESIVSKDVRSYFDSLIKCISSATASNDICFKEDLIFAIPGGTCMLGYENILPKEFKGFSMTAKTAKFFTRLLTGNEIIDVYRDQSTMIVSIDKLLVSFKNSVIKSEYLRPKHVLKVARQDDNGNPMEYSRPRGEGKRHLDFLDRSHCMVLDKVYLLDVLRRFTISGDEAVLGEINKNESNGTYSMVLRSKKFLIELPILKSKDMDFLLDKSIKIVPSILEKVIVSDDVTFTTETFVYLKQVNGILYMTFTDNSAFWFGICNFSCKEKIQGR